ncbi:ABC transporter permease [[Eubacterium] cellulosolvens]
MSRLKDFSNVFAVMFNEFRILKRNRSAILISLVVIPFFFTASLGAGRGGEGETYSSTANLPIAFIDNDLSEASGRLYETLVRSEDFSMLIQGYREETALKTLGTGGIYAAIVVPEGFQEKLLNNETGIIIVHVDDGSPGVDDAVLSNIESSLRNFNPNPRIQQMGDIEFAGVEILMKGASFSGFAIGLTITLTMVVVFATFYEIAGGMSRESETGTYAHLLVSPVSLGSIMVGKTLYDVCLNIMRTFIVLGLAVYVYGASIHTNLFSLVLSTLFIAILTMGFGFLVSSFGVGVRAVVIIEFFLILFLFAFSGFFIDKELLRGISQTIATVLPWAYGIDILKRTILIGQPLLSLTYQLQIIALSILLFYGVAYLLLRLSRERLIK